MRLLPLLLILPTTLSAPITYLAGLTSNTHDLSTTNPSAPSKYFHEFRYHPHYDGRFASKILPRSTRLFHMRLMVRAYASAMARAGVRTWVMHGSLLAWRWNGAVFPWDSDVDFCVDEGGLGELAGWWNMSVHHFWGEELGVYTERVGKEYGKGGGGVERVKRPEGLEEGTWEKVVEEGKKYLLEVNPHSADLSTNDRQNVIDARWVDTATGLFIDITAVHPVPSAKHHTFLSRTGAPEHATKNGHAGAEMFTKDTHLYSTAALFPLRETQFEGARVWVPFAYEQLLEEEYGPRALTERWYRGFWFDERKREWVLAEEGVPEGVLGRV